MQTLEESLPESTEYKNTDEVGLLVSCVSESSSSNQGARNESLATLTPHKAGRQTASVDAFQDSTLPKMPNHKPPYLNTFSSPA